MGTTPAPMPTASKTFNLSTFILSHMLWIIAIGVGLIGYHSWLVEHDQRIAAQAAITSAESQVKTLEQEIQQRDQQTAQAVAPIVKIIHDTVTVPQAIAALPQVVNQPLPAPVLPAPNNAVIIPEPDIIPLFDQVADDKVCRQLLTTSQADFLTETSIVTQKNAEIVALKKKPKFWSRVKSTLKVLGIGAAIGVGVAKYI